MNNFKSTIKKLPGLLRVYKAYKFFFSMAKSSNSRFINFAPPGHFYSPIPDLNNVMAKQDSLFDRDSKECPGIDLRENSQLELLEKISSYYDDLPFPETPGYSTRYYYKNGLFGYGDAIILYSFLRHFRPQRVIEAGSGFSSALMLDTNRLFLEDSAHLTFIEPYQYARLFDLVGREELEKHTVIQEPLQSVPPDMFRSLCENDMLFIDSSHVAKIGSDVTYIFFNILPALNPGTIIHFHDIHWPFEYPKEWVLQGRAWNEAYFLRTFLQFNNNFEILFFNPFIFKFHSGVIKEKMPLCLKALPAPFQTNRSSSIWLRKKT